MREIKFRVWAKTDENNWEQIGVYDTQECPNSFWEGESLHSLGLTLYDFPKDEFDVQQYTGLKDKNGKEIYERDLINFTHYYGEGDHEDYKSQEVYYDCEVGCYLFGKHEMSLLDDLSDLEVVGNIYENKG